MESVEKSAKKLVVIIPAYNEAERIQEAITNIQSIKTELAKIGFELFVCVVDDGSVDSTALLAQKTGAHRIVRHKVNLGLGAAVRSGLFAARKAGADIVVKFDADLQHDPNDIIPLINPILSDEADVVYGNRFERISYRMPLVRRAGNIAFTKLMGMLTGWPLKDSQPGVSG
jgi:glycosyltransferase involved in cell wall biosynthesis